MIKKLIIAVVAFAAAIALVYGVGAAAGAGQNVGLPTAITDDSPCPVVLCANGQCHGFDNVPDPDGVSEMACPEVGCASVDCHAWDTLENRYHKASNGSLNLWVLAPIMLVLGLVLIVKKVGK